MDFSLNIHIPERLPLGLLIPAMILARRYWIESSFVKFFLLVLSVILVTWEVHFWLALAVIGIFMYWYNIFERVVNLVSL